MQLDVTELRDFYHKPLGIAVRRLLRQKIREKWPSVKNMNVIGLGFAAPYLGVFKEEALRLGAFMPEEQGVILWPRKGPYCSALTRECMLPLADASVDRCLIVHSLEMSEAAGAMLREVWRVLAPEGKIILIVPNRKGMWARIETTPFGYGRPYSRSQLKQLLRDNMFTPNNITKTLYMPPMTASFLLNTINAWEKVGERFWPVFSGLLMVEASKEIYAATPKSGIKIVPGLAPLPFK